MTAEREKPLRQLAGQGLSSTTAPTGCESEYLAAMVTQAALRDRNAEVQTSKRVMSTFQMRRAVVGYGVIGLVILLSVIIGLSMRSSPNPTSAPLTAESNRSTHPSSEDLVRNLMEEKRAAEQKAAAEKARADRYLEDKKAAEQKAAAERANADKLLEDKKIAEQKAVAERANAEKLLEQARTADEKAAAEKAVAEKLKDEKRAAEEKAAAEKAVADKLKDEKRTAEEKAAAEKAVVDKLKDEKKAADEKVAAQQVMIDQLKKEKEAAAKQASSESSTEKEKNADTKSKYHPVVKLPDFPGFTPSSERLDIDPALQGVWVAHVISMDRGKTLDYVGGITFARVTATKIKLVGKNDLVVDRVIMCDTDEGDPGNIIVLKEGQFICVSKERGQPFCLVQVIDRQSFKELTRVVITVEK